MKIYLVRSREHAVHITDLPYEWHTSTNQWRYNKRYKEGINFCSSEGDIEFYQYLLTLVPKVEEPVEIEL
jgi:hypothetical protein